MLWLILAGPPVALILTIRFHPAVRSAYRESYRRVYRRGRR